jgi:hypothetical protein
MNARHAVVDVYDLFRTARLNVRYLETQLKVLQGWSLGMEIVLALTASSIAGGLWIFQNNLGSIFWKFLGSIAAIIAILRPIIDLTRRIKRKQALLTGYRALEHDLHTIAVLVSQRRKYDAELQERFKNALDRKGRLIEQDSEALVNKKRLEKCYQEVLAELPADKFYVPEGQES